MKHDLYGHWFDPSITHSPPPIHVRTILQNEGRFGFIDGGQSLGDEILFAGGDGGEVGGHLGGDGGDPAQVRELVCHGLTLGGGADIPRGGLTADRSESMSVGVPRLGAWRNYWPIRGDGRRSPLWQLC